uniref:MLLT3 super elongation complex subunit n=1 Tax=Molossus molossus TaxID=27622 RepID=A0A7J8EEN6_MOLMO|nr:MLLT3 super elongation complex subunit [Molossus molossus]
MCAVQVKLELGHRAQVRKKPTVEGFTHDWMVFVRGPEHSNIQHFVEKVVFHLHESFPRPKRGADDFLENKTIFLGEQELLANLGLYQLAVIRAIISECHRTEESED